MSKNDSEPCRDIGVPFTILRQRCVKPMGYLKNYMMPVFQGVYL